TAITAILACAGTLTPNFFVLTMRSTHYQVYEFWQITDPIATIEQLSKNPSVISLLVLAPGAMAGFVFLLNLPTMARGICTLHALGAARPTAKRVWEEVEGVEEVEAVEAVRS